MDAPILCINTSVGNDRIEASIVVNGKAEHVTAIAFDSGDTQQILPELVALLETAGIAIGDGRHQERTQPLAGITVVHGAERFTIARLATVIANTLARSLAVPIRGYMKRPVLEEICRDISSTVMPCPMLEPVYAAEPRIGNPNGSTAT